MKKSLFTQKNNFSHNKNWSSLLKNIEIERKQAVLKNNSDLYDYGANNPVHYIDPDGKAITNNTKNFIIARLEDPIKLSDGTEIDTVVLAPGDTYKGNVDGTRDLDGNYTKISAQSNQTVNYSVEEDNSIKFLDNESKKNNFKNDLKKALNNIFPFVFGWKLYSGSYEKGELPAKYLASEWDDNFKSDLGEDGFQNYEAAYDSEKQKLLRKEYGMENEQ